MVSTHRDGSPTSESPPAIAASSVGHVRTSGRTDSRSPEQTRGRTAEEPEQIPPLGWWDIAWRVMKRLGTDNVTLLAGGLAMYALLSIFPGLAAAVSIYALFATPADVLKQMSAFAGMLPPGAWDIVHAQLASIIEHTTGTLTTAAIIGLLMALWSARSAMSSLMTATNVAYGEREKRGFFKQILLSLAFTAGAILGFLAMLALGVAIPLGLQAFQAAPWVKVAAAVSRFLLLWLLAAAGLAVIYRHAPAREHARWRWVTWGSIVAATLWIGATALFALYVRDFGYGKTYGALGGVIVLLMWFFISSVVVILGAEINAEMERQTVKDTTIKQNAPLGERGAYAADTVGPSAGGRDQYKPSPAKGLTQSPRG